MPRRRNRSPRVRPAPVPAGDAITEEVANPGASFCDCESCYQAGIAEEPLKQVETLQQSVQKPKSWVSSNVEMPRHTSDCIFMFAVPTLYKLSNLDYPMTTNVFVSFNRIYIVLAKLTVWPDKPRAAGGTFFVPTLRLRILYLTYLVSLDPLQFYP